MAKDKGRTKLPKKVAGVKVPKKLRKAANKLIADVETPQAQASVAAGAAAVAAAATAFVQSAAVARMIDDAKRQAETVVGRIADEVERERAATPPAAAPWIGLVATAMNAAMAGLRQRTRPGGEPPIGEAPHRRTD